MAVLTQPTSITQSLEDHALISINAMAFQRIAQPSWWAFDLRGHLVDRAVCVRFQPLAVVQLTPPLRARHAAPVDVVGAKRAAHQVIRTTQLGCDLRCRTMRVGNQPLTVVEQRKPSNRTFAAHCSQAITAKAVV